MAHITMETRCGEAMLAKEANMVEDTRMDGITGHTKEVVGRHKVGERQEEKAKIKEERMAMQEEQQGKVAICLVCGRKVVKCIPCGMAQMRIGMVGMVQANHQSNGVEDFASH